MELTTNAAIRKWMALYTLRKAFICEQQVAHTCCIYLLIKTTAQEIKMDTEAVEKLMERLVEFAIHDG